jgi:hypothetical protein
VTQAARDVLQKQYNGKIYQLHNSACMGLPDNREQNTGFDKNENLR